MRLLSQNIAQRANKDDGEVGKFWQSRYRGVRLIDATAVLACAAYVDLNPIRAAMAESIEESDFTSAQKRAAGLKSRFGSGTAKDTRVSKAGQARLGTGGSMGSDVGREERGGSAATGKNGEPVPDLKPCLSARHLAPVDLKERTVKPGPNLNKQGSRCSNKGFLPMSTADYLTLLDWTARVTRSDKRDSTPKELAPIFARLGISESVWLELVQNFGRLFSVVAGQPQRVDEFRSKTKEQRYHLRKDARELMA
jgi:hypothetical protein